MRQEKFTVSDELELADALEQLLYLLLYFDVEPDMIFKFAQTYRDSDSGLDYAQNRYYASGIGRFLTTDPLDKSACLLPFPNDAARRLVLPHPPAALACPAFLAVAVCSLVGCSTQQFGLAEQGKVPSGTGASLIAQVDAGLRLVLAL